MKGIRLIQAQGHDYPTNETTNPSGISLCHTSCYLQDGGSLESWLIQARNWLDANPREVLTILVTNPDSVNLTRWKKGFEYSGFNSTNVFSPSSQHTSRNDWPTLGQLIDSGKRTIAIMDYGANFTQLPWLIEEFSNVWENPYDQLSECVSLQQLSLFLTDILPYFTQPFHSIAVWIEVQRMITSTFIITSKIFLTSAFQHLIRMNLQWSMPLSTIPMQSSRPCKDARSRQESGQHMLW